MTKWVIDRFEGDVAVLESLSGEETIHSKRTDLPKGVKEGDILVKKAFGFELRKREGSNTADRFNSLKRGANDTERLVAITILMEINEQKAYNNIALRRNLQARNDWQSYKKAFVTELVNGTLRNVILIDHIIENFSKNPVSSFKPFIRELLRTAVYQIKWMSKVPNSAAVNEAVNLASLRGFTQLSGFVNGILRNITRSYEKDGFSSILPIVPSTDNKEDLAQYLSIRYSFPPWLAKSLIDWLGDYAEEYCKLSHIAPDFTIYANTLKIDTATLLEKLLETRKNIVQDDNALAINGVKNVVLWEEYKNGEFVIMDRGAYEVAKAVSAKPNQNIIDLCAAPGSKSFIIAGDMQNQGQIMSFDIFPHKIDLIRNTASRLGITCITALERDSTVVAGEFQDWADVVLLDAPCSGFGVIRKKPDIKYTKKRTDILALVELQRKLLTAAADYVKPGGVLVYSTCTITPEENENNVRWFLENFPFVQDSEPRANGLKSGFFIAKMTKKP
ncbi:MAG: 16S rRNA (cytosine(967)-C(5))-methyltransferase RsmB [Turicibacter sp.]|nr:16S rRNA (cytosine(967)-C(5))-methyltransferase RsmB [Turicibacter sp.]